ncbi:MAG: stage V sporulation protein B [Pelotomaculum sp.]|uniref:Membrane protein n=1 Tax=Pelotomaculum thermopropionicum (strain DSM 13744 / JCM 10971 / SI) TaxID=370438 RepID=A5D2G5_PELTS|nr:stage V sporulation protein B [Pelotomaculum sp.]BAF59577.1 membrane protein [Pelotomaculum thermopropionicum SI]
MAGQSFLYGTAVLVLASLFNRILGFIYQILLIRLILPEGIGLFNMVYPVYVLVLVMATAGIPVAISKLVAEEMARNNLHGAYRIFKMCFIILTFNSVFFTVLCFLIVPLLLEYVFPNPKVFFIFLSLIPGIVIVSLCSAFRGFFQGLQQMAPTAVTQSLEQLVRIIFGLFMARLLFPKGIEYAAAGASIGVIAGEVAGLIAMIVIYLKKRPALVSSFVLHPGESFCSILRKIAGMALPVTMARIVSTILLSLDAILIPQRLQAGGLGLSEATSVYGQFVGIAESLLFIPGIVTVSMAVALIPSVSEALAVKRIDVVRAHCEKAVRITLLTGLPFAAMLLILSEELCGFIFGYPEAGKSLEVLAVGGPFLYVQQTTTGILQGLGEASRPLRNLVLASLFKITGIYFLTGLPQFGIRGAAIAIVAGYIITAWLNLADIYRLTGFRLNARKTLLKPVAALSGMLVSIFFLHNLPAIQEIPGPFEIISTATAGLIVYILFLSFTGSINLKSIYKIKNIFLIKSN